jgi:biotin operon repressor
VIVDRTALRADRARLERELMLLGSIEAAADELAVLDKERSLAIAPPPAGAGRRYVWGTGEPDPIFLVNGQEVSRDEFNAPRADVNPDAAADAAAIDEVLADGPPPDVEPPCEDETAAPAASAPPAEPPRVEPPAPPPDSPSPVDTLPRPTNPCDCGAHDVERRHGDPIPVCVECGAARPVRVYDAPESFVDERPDLPNQGDTLAHDAAEEDAPEGAVDLEVDVPITRKPGALVDTFWRSDQTAEAAASNDRLVLRELERADGEWHSASDIARGIGVTPTQVKRPIKRLLETGRIEHNGGRTKLSGYRIPPPAADVGEPGLGTTNGTTEGRILTALSRDPSTTEELAAKLELTLERARATVVRLHTEGEVMLAGKRAGNNVYAATFPVGI